ncbi:MAG TPA: hypothetical protein DHW14_09595 [Clostridiales bacterium]|nr:hypothetical protein [Clostridiales bacterium]
MLSTGDPMNVLIPLARFSPSGQTSHVVDLAGALARSGVRVTLVHSRPADPTCTGPDEYRPLLAGTGVAVLSHDLAAGLPNGAPRPDVVHAHSTLDFPLAERLARRHGAAFVVTVHGLGCGRILAGASLARADAVIAVGRRVAADIAGLAAGRVVVIENGVDTDRFHPPAGGSRPRGRTTVGGEVRVLYAGRVDAERRAGFTELIRALAALSRHRRVRAVVLSDRPPGVAPALLAGPRVSLDFPGWLVDPSPVFRTADVVVGCGRVIREGMASGRPCLLLGRSYRGLVLPAALDPARGHDFGAGGREGLPSAERIAADLLRLVRDPDLATRLGAEGRAYALAHLSLAEVAARTVALYEKVRR